MLEIDNEYLIYLEKIRWQQVPQCPYCNSKRASSYKHERRYHCLDCFTTYSVMVGTPFQGTHVHLRKWFYAVFMVVNFPDELSVRKLAHKIKVNKNTASRMLNRLRGLEGSDFELLKEIAKFDGIDSFEF